VDLDPAYWLNLGRQAAIIVGIGAVFGGPAGIVTWRRTNSRGMAISFAIGAAVVGLLVVGYIYLNVVLCPPGAGCA
jgi:Na+/proline symporter